MGSNWSKWGKYKIMRNFGSVRGYLPETHWLKEKRLWNMLSRYGAVVVKPSGSSGGQGVCMVTALGSDTYEVQTGRKKSKVTGRKAVYSKVRKYAGKNSIVQKKISLSRVGGRPFDLRVMVQRKRGSTHWEVTGTLAKVAGKGYLITNTSRSKGYITTIDRALSYALTRDNAVRARRRIYKAAKAAACSLDGAFPKQRVMGIDMGVEDSGKVWVIEANFKPALSLFRMLKDKSMLRRIQSYGYRI
jgi:hypothetical protein